MSWAEAQYVIDELKQENSVPAEILAYAQDYKVFGEDSYVFRNKELLHKLYETFEVSMNADFSSEVIDYLAATAPNRIGEAISHIHEVYNKEAARELKNLSDVVQNPVIMGEVLHSDKLWDHLSNSESFMVELSKNSTALNGVLASEKRLNDICANERKSSWLVREKEGLVNVFNNTEIFKYMTAHDTALRGFVTSKAFVSFTIPDISGLDRAVNNKKLWNAILQSKNAVSQILKTPAILDGLMGGYASKRDVWHYFLNSESGAEAAMEIEENKLKVMLNHSEDFFFGALKNSAIAVRKFIENNKTRRLLEIDSALRNKLLGEYYIREKMRKDRKTWRIFVSNDVLLDSLIKSTSFRSEVFRDGTAARIMCSNSKAVKVLEKYTTRYTNSSFTSVSGIIIIRSGGTIGYVLSGDSEHGYGQYIYPSNTERLRYETFYDVEDFVKKHPGKVVTGIKCSSTWADAISV